MQRFSQLVSVRSEDGPVIAAHGGKGFEGTKSTLFFSKRQRNTSLLARLSGTLPLDVRLQKHIYLSTYVEP